MANVLSLYLLLPSGVLWPLVWLGSRGWPAASRRVVITAAMLPLGILLLLYGGLFLPRIAPTASGDAQTLKVMTLNVLYSNDDGSALERLIQAEAPDLVCLQELSPRLAADLAARLAEGYPYRALMPEEGVTGLGVFSRHPLRDEGEVPDPAWKHGAQVVTVEFGGRSVLVLNVHALSNSWPRLSRAWPPAFERESRLREEQIRRWLDRLARHEGPAVVAGDLNTTDQNGAYRMMATRLTDAHRSAGWGLGHTAPASTAGLDRVSSPSRLWRIDLVWHSDHWRALASHVGEWDGQSDHLPVFAELVLR